MLDELRYIDRKIERIAEEISKLQRYKDILYGFSGIDTSATVAKIDAYISEISNESLELAAKKKQTLEAIDSLPDPEHRELLQLRYIEGLSWEKIADAMFYSHSYVYRIHKKALKAFKQSL